MDMIINFIYIQIWQRNDLHRVILMNFRNVNTTSIIKKIKKTSNYLIFAKYSKDKSVQSNTIFFSMKRKKKKP